MTSTESQSVETDDTLIAAAIDLFDGHDGQYGTTSVPHICNVLGIDRPPSNADPSFLVLAAMALSPRRAVQYELSDPKPRWKYIFEYLTSFSCYDTQSLVHLARRIAGILDKLGRQRKGLNQNLLSLMARQGSVCAICRSPFHQTPRAVLMRDPLRPLWQAPEELTQPEVDHISPISWTGDNSDSNLQVLCRACNAAKADGVRIAPHREAALAQLAISEVPRIHLFRLLVWLADDNQRNCEICGATDGELTMRLRHPDACLIRANLRLACYQCL